MINIANSIKKSFPNLREDNPRMYNFLKRIYKNKYFHYSRHYIKYWFLPIFTGSYSQYSEDKMIDNLLGYKNKGFYIDIGANRPTMMNNTYKFYKRGWRGINIEPQTHLLNLFINKRNNDINLNVGVSSATNQNLEFHIFKEDELSTFSNEAKQYYIDNGHILIKTEMIPIRTLKSIIDEYKDVIHEIDFMSIDVEGFELEVLDSYDWSKKPKLIIMESNGHNKSGKNVLSIHMNYLEKYGYYLKYFNGLNSFFILEE